MNTKQSWLLNLLFILVLLLFLLNHDYSNLYLAGLGGLMSIVACLWLLSVAIRDASIVDIFWGLGFVLLIWYYSFLVGFENLGTRNWVLLALVTTWGLRLSIYLGFRNIGSGEDYRYQTMRKNGGKNWWIVSFFKVFMLQGILIWLISSLFLPSLKISGELVFWDYLGIGIWCIGFFFEAIGDNQLRRFKKDPANKGLVMDKGLWKYTRHPNYFGDATLWFGYFFLCLAHPNSIYFILCPLIMTIFLRKISGADLLESTLIQTKPKYAEYIRKTSAFLPWWRGK